MGPIVRISEMSDWNDRIRKKIMKWASARNITPPQNRVLAITKHVERSVCSLGITIRAQGMEFGIREGCIVV
jgi:hypothetical protein